MGVHDFTATFTPTEAQTTLARIRDMDMAVDAFPEMFRATAMQHASKLTNPAGEPTMHLTVAFANAVARKASGGDDIWIFDSREPRAEGDSKNGTLQSRAEIRERNMAELARLEAELARLENLSRNMSRADLLELDPSFDMTLQAKRDEIEQMRARNPDKHHFGKMIRNVLFILQKLGIRYAFAPPGCDAEKLAAQFCRDKVVDGVITVDTDSLVYGCTVQIKKIAGKSGKYERYDLADVLTRYKITQQQLAEVASVLGCDFCKKTPGVGAKTVVDRVKAGKITYTAEQIAAQKRFLDTTPCKYEYFEPQCTRQSLDELRDWLVRVQGFGADGVEKKLRPFYP